MADFFGDLFDAVTGQGVAPQQTIIPTNELLGQSFGTLNSTVAPGLIGWNQAMAPGITNVGIGVANQVDPSILGNFRGANKSILDQLNLGSSMSPELQAEITRGLLSTSANTGFGASAGGTGGILYQTAMDKENLRRRREQDALAAGTSGVGVAKSFYDPLQYSQMGLGAASGIAQNIQQVQAAKDEAANMAEDIRRQNFSALINTGGRIMGTVVGGVFGGAPGAQIGGSIGGSLVQGSRVGGRGQEGAGGMGGSQFTSLLSGLFSGGGKGGGGGGGSIGGPQYGIGGNSFNNSSLGGGNFGYDASVGF